MNIIHKLFGKYRYKTMSAIILILVVCIIFICFYFYSDKSEKIDNTDFVNSTEYQSIADKNDGTLSGDSCILVVCNSEKVGEAVFMTLLDFHIFAERIVITPLDLNVTDGTRSYAETYAYGGINDLIFAVEKVRNCKIDRYAIINKNGISKLTDILGSVNLYVQEEFTYESADKSYTVTAGYNDLEAAMLYSFLKINSENDNKIAELLCSIINTYLTEIDVNKSQELFGELCNCINTDITIGDYYTCSSDINYLLTHNTKCVVFDEGE